VARSSIRRGEYFSGDTLIITSGTYYFADYGDDIIRPPHGNPGDYTTVIGHGATKPLLLGSDNLYSIFELGSSWDSESWIHIENFEIASLIDAPYTGGVREGIEAGSWGDTVSHYIFKNIEIYHVEEAGINIAGDADYITLEACSIHHTGLFALGGPSPSGDGWTNILIDSCYLSYAGHFYGGVETPSPYDRPDGLGFEDSEGPIEIRYTTAEHNLGDGLDSKSKRTHIHHCTVANNTCDGVKLWGDSSYVENTLICGTGDGDPSSSPWCLLVLDTEDSDGHYEIVNVTMWDSPGRNAHYVGTCQYDNSGVHVTLVFRNNIIVGRRMFFARPIVDIVAENNLFFIEGEEQIFAGDVYYDSTNIGSFGSGNIYGDPLFAGPAWGSDGDFHLNALSPARDAGTAVALTDDLDGNPRPIGTGFDIGCYEFTDIGVSEITTTPSAYEIRAYPNPFNSSVTISISGECDTPLRIEIYDVAGRKIVESPPAPLIKGRAEQSEAGGLFVWTPEKSLGSGVYLLRACYGEEPSITKIIYLK